MKAADAQLETASDSCERWEWGCAEIVVAAVFAEFAIAWIHPPYSSLLERLGSAIANFVVAAGIVGEVIFSRRDSKIQTELRKRSNQRLEEAVERTADANRAAEEERAARLTLEAQLQPRMLTPEQTHAIAALRGKLDCVLISWETDAETQWFALNIGMAFRLAGITTFEGPRAPNIHSFGSLIYDPHMVGAKSSEGAQALYDIFRREMGLALSVITRLPDDIQLPPGKAADMPGIIIGGRFLVPPYAVMRKPTTMTARDLSI